MSWYIPQVTSGVKGQAYLEQEAKKSPGPWRAKREDRLPDRSALLAPHSLVKDGWCWWYRRYAPGDAVLEELEKAAREAMKSLSADPQPVPPWE